MLKLPSRLHLGPLWMAAALACATAVAAEYEAVVLEKEPPKDDVAPEIAERLQPTGIAVKQQDRTVCEIWLCKTWSVRPDFQASLQLLYPFKEGELIGVVRYPRKANDFRDQEIARGVYTFRYSLQPVDGNHVGTSPTRDFFLLLPAESDKSAAPIEAAKVIEQSTEASQTSHPALLALQSAQKSAGALPALRHDEAPAGGSYSSRAKSEAEGTEAEVRVDVVVVGIAVE